MIGGPPIAAGSYIQRPRQPIGISNNCALSPQVLALKIELYVHHWRPSLRLTPRTWNDQVTELKSCDRYFVYRCCCFSKEARGERAG